MFCCFPGHAENMAALTEGMATALHCFKDLGVLRYPGLMAQKFCVLICNSPPYPIVVQDVPGYQGQTLEQLATQIPENNIQLSIISPRRLPNLVNFPSPYYLCFCILILMYSNIGTIV